MTTDQAIPVETQQEDISIADTEAIQVPLEWRFGYDSASGVAIPPAIVPGQVVMGYPDRRPDPWTPDDFKHYEQAGATIARITQSDPPDWPRCSIADWELGAIFNPTSLREFVINRHWFRSGTQTVYSDLDNLQGDRRPPLSRILQGLPWNAWLAHWKPPLYPIPDPAEIDYLKSLLPPHVKLVAIQYKPGQHYDTSVVIDPQWHRRDSSLRLAPADPYA